ncbi:hypothetical protein BD414DRAFT_570777 [Trametes punicea]|nr:hypothetical protein BD414DRAFT_570777 [Trametes punicea]
MPNPTAVEGPLSFAERKLTLFQALFSERILHIELIYELIFDCSSAATLLRIARTCRAGHHAVAAYTRLAFDVDRLLSRFFPSGAAPCSSICAAPPPHEHSQAHDRARAFRSLQARTGTLVSGSCALQLFDRTVYPESDLDLYVHMRHRREVGRWLIREGYEFAPTPYQDSRFEIEVVHGMSRCADGIYRMPGVAGILTFKKGVSTATKQPAIETEDTELGAQVDIEQREEENELKVQIIVAKNTPMEVILGFHSTCVMNVISYEKAYCLFPQATLEDRLSLLTSSCRGRSRHRASGIIKYSNRGFTMTAAPGPEELEYGFSPSAPRGRSYAESLYGPGSEASLVDGAASPPQPQSHPRLFGRSKPAFRLGWRWIDDSASWVLPLPLAGVAPPPAANASTAALTHDTVSVCNWEMRHDGPARGVVMHFEIAAGSL